MIFLIGLFLLGIGAAAVLLPEQTLPAGLAPGDVAGMAMYGSLALAVAAGVIARFRGRIMAGFLSALAWVGILAVILAGYTYRDSLTAIADRLLGELVPGTISAGIERRAAYSAGR